MYDIEFIVPVSSREKYLQRCLDLKTHAFFNNGQKKTLIRLLGGSDDEFPTDILSGWEPGITVELLRYPYREAAPKMARYFAELKTAENARWFAKLDDDTINDISNLVDNLDEFYDYKKENYIVAELRDEMHGIELNILKQMGKKWTACLHEKEGSIISQAGLQAVLNNPEAREFCKLRSLADDGWGDIFLAIAAKFCKFYAVHAPFMASWLEFGRFSGFGGDLCHIHPIARDVNTECFYAWNRFLNPPEIPIWDNIKNKEYLFCEGERPIHLLRFEKNGIIHNAGNEKFWKYVDGELIFIATQGFATFTLAPLDETCNKFVIRHSNVPGGPYYLRFVP